MCSLPFPAQEGTGAAEDLATPKLDNQLMRGRVGCVLGLDLVSAAALPYLIRQLATAPPMRASLSLTAWEILCASGYKSA